MRHLQLASHDRCQARNRAAIEWLLALVWGRDAPVFCGASVNIVVQVRFLP